MVKTKDVASFLEGKGFEVVYMSGSYKAYLNKQLTVLFEGKPNHTAKLLVLSGQSEALEKAIDMLKSFFEDNKAKPIVEKSFSSANMGVLYL